MVATKCADYEVAGLYLKGSEYDLEAAVEGWRADERWERENPLKKGKGKNARNRRLGGGGGGGGSIAGQLS